MMKYAIILALIITSWLFGSKHGYDKREAIAVAHELQLTGAQLELERKHRAKEKEWQDDKEKAIREGREREKKLVADANSSRIAANRMHKELTDFRQQLPSLADDAVRRYADTASIVLSECTAEYQSLAEIVDRIDNDRQRLMDAWVR